MMEENTDNTKIFKELGKNNVIHILKKSLNEASHLDKSFNVSDIVIKDNSILVYYKPDSHNNLLIFSDFSMVIGFIYGFLKNDFFEQKIYNVGIYADCGNEKEIYIISPIKSAEAITKGDAIYWLHNSYISEQLILPEEKYLLVEGESEQVVFPILFESIGIDIDKYKIKIYPYSKFNLKTLLSLFNHKKDSFFLVCDSDKKNEILNLKREGLLNNNYCILKNGELEDYIDPLPLIKILKTFTPNIALLPEYIENNRLRGLGTSKIVQKYYYEESPCNQNPPKPDIAKQISQYWIKNEIPKEFLDIMHNVLAIRNS